MVTIKWAVGLCGLSLFSSGCSTPSDITAQQRSGLVNGRIDPDTTGVYALQNRVPDLLLCTAVLVAPNVLLTARHCVSDSGEQTVNCGTTPLGSVVDSQHLSLSNALSVFDTADPGAGEEFGIDRIEVPTIGDVCGGDVAAVVLGQPLRSTPLGLRLTPGPENGETYTALGYGTMTTSQGSRAGVRLRLEGLAVDCVGERCAGEVDESEFRGADGVCLGDSGGPALDNGQRVFGIASRSAADCQAPVYSSLPAHREWLLQILEQAAQEGGYAFTLDAVEPKLPEGDPGPTPTSDPQRVMAGLGDACSSQSPCDAGLICFYDSSPDQATCATACATDTDCGEPGDGEHHCDPQFHVCRKRPRSGAEGCALGGAAEGPSPPSGWLLSTLALCAVLLRRGGRVWWRRP